MKNFVYIILTLVFISVVLFQACSDNLTGTEIDQIDIPNENVSYSQYIQPVFNVKCTSSGCHDNQSVAGGLSLTSWANTTANPQVVFPGQPQNSKLVWAIKGELGSTIMPPLGYPPLTEDQIQGVVTWIEEGAKSN